jgi:hypothetical protein
MEGLGVWWGGVWVCRMLEGWEQLIPTGKTATERWRGKSLDKVGERREQLHDETLLSELLDS